LPKICILGLGYIGLPTACLLATHGYQVAGVDTDSQVVPEINQGNVPFEEPGLQELLEKALASQTFRASTEPEAADVFLIAVPTPLDKETRMADLSHVREAAKSIASCLEEGGMVVLESTVPPGTCERLVLPILEASGLIEGRDFHLVHCPERAIPGNTVREIVLNDRVIGGRDRRSAELAKEIYSCFVKGDLYLTDLRTAEMVKLMENTFRDINIALANDFAQIAEESGVNIWEAIELANKHPRVNMLKPGPGVGGHCIAIDPWFLAENSAASRIISLAREINDSMPRHILNLVRGVLGGIKEATITVLGVAYKGDVGDTRETPAVRFIRLAENEGYTVRSHDPWVKAFEYPLYPLEDAVKDSDCVVLITDHSQFGQIDPEKISPLMRNRNLLDTRDMLDSRRWAAAGFRVKVIGDGTG
jgi:UDP-N-acetyl-D-mannosaminuronic acid dehydrogenase